MKSLFFYGIILVMFFSIFLSNEISAKESDEQFNLDSSTIHEIAFSENNWIMLNKYQVTQNELIEVDVNLKEDVGFIAFQLIDPNGKIISIDTMRINPNGHDWTLSLPNNAALGKYVIYASINNSGRGLVAQAEFTLISSPISEDQQKKREDYLDTNKDITSIQPVWQPSNIHFSSLVRPVNLQGNSLASVAGGQQAAFEVILCSPKNQHVVVSVNLFDSSGTTLWIGLFMGDINGGKSSVIISNIIPKNVEGTVTAYANVLTGLPSLGGKPLALESLAEVPIGEHMEIIEEESLESFECMFPQDKPACDCTTTAGVTGNMGVVDGDGNLFDMEQKKYDYKNKGKPSEEEKKKFDERKEKKKTERSGQKVTIEGDKAYIEFGVKGEVKSKGKEDTIHPKVNVNWNFKSELTATTGSPTFGDGSATIDVGEMLCGDSRPFGKLFKIEIPQPAEANRKNKNISFELAISVSCNECPVEPNNFPDYIRFTLEYTDKGELRKKADDTAKKSWEKPMTEKDWKEKK